MRNKIYLVALTVAVFLSLWLTYAADAQTWVQSTWAVISWKQKIAQNKAKQPTALPLLTLQRFFDDVCTEAGKGIPLSYTDIRVTRPWVKAGTSFYRALQKCVYLGILQPRARITNLSFTPNGDFIYDFFSEKFHILLNVALPWDEPVTLANRDDNISTKIPSYAGVQRLLQASSRWSNSSYLSDILQSPSFSALSTVYSTLQQTYHYLSGWVDDATLIYGWVQGMVDSLHDKYSTYFPPDNTSNFLSDIQGEYEWVGAYVDAINGKFTFVWLVAWSPAMEAGIQAGDHVVAVDDRVVPEVFTLNEVISRIKWPAGTKVAVTIERNGTILKITMERRKVSIPLLDVKKKNGNLIFAITSFGRTLDTQFIKTLTNHKQDIIDAKNIIIDLRNNGGWYVDVVTNMMNYFVNSGQVLLRYEFKWSNERVLSEGPAISPFANKNIIILINKWTASAAEILAWVIKDYYPTARLVWENSYGKWSMQSLSSLPNGWSFKYTIALRYIGKSKLSIEKTGLKPDIEIKDDTKTIADEVMDTVLGW
jgi:carboxyl-terminal processing protease